jgi:hypothetical protein
LRTFDEFSVKWVSDTASQVDFINGFIEVYSDPLGMKGTWEGIVNFKSEEASKRTRIISDNAQWFEDNAPIDSRFKKNEVVGVSAKVVTVAMLGGEALCRFGACVAEAAHGLGSRAVFIASGDLSHKLAHDGPYGYNPAGPEFDRHIVDCVRNGDTQGIVGIDEDMLEESAQCGYYGIAMMRGAIERAAELRSRELRAAAPATELHAAAATVNEVYSYEGPFGIGYAVARSGFR